MTNMRNLLLAAISALCVSTASAQTREDRIRNLCLPIVNAAVTHSISMALSSQEQSDFEEFVCSQNYSSQEEASSSGINVEAVYNGVELGALWSSDSTERAQARQTICTNTSTNFERSYNSVVTIINRLPTASADYQRCVNQALQSQDDLACFLYSTADPQDLQLSIVYRPATARPTTKLSKVAASNLTIPNSNEPVQAVIEKLIRESGREPQQQFLQAFTLPFELRRAALGNASLGVYLNDGQSCLAEIAGSPATMNVNMTVFGSGLRQGEQVVSFTIDDTKGCADDTSSHAVEFEVPAGALIQDGQNFLGQGWQVSSNCPRGESRLSEIKQLSSTRLRASYTLRGCGYDPVFRSCKGRGWLDHRFSVRTRLVDPTLPSSYSIVKDQSFANGRIPMTTVRFDRALPRDFVVAGVSFAAEFEIPDMDANGNIIYATGTISGQTGGTPGGAVQECTAIKLRNGRSVSIAGSFVTQDVVSIMEVPDCDDSYRGHILNTVSSVNGVLPDTACARRLDGLPRADMNADQLDQNGQAQFEAAANCRR